MNHLTHQKRILYLVRHILQEAQYYQPLDQMLFDYWSCHIFYYITSLFLYLAAANQSICKLLVPDAGAF
jgi:hypothetical protein